MSEPNCRGCTACCNMDLIVLHPEMGDNPSNYETIEVPHPLTGKPCVALKVIDGYGCAYRGEKGCTIYDKRPAICREFDCRKFVKCMPKRELEGLLADGFVSTDVVRQGKRLENTLTGQERLECIELRKKKEMV